MEYNYEKVRQTTYGKELSSNWKQYATELTEYILKFANEGDVVAIYGAGKMQDICIEKLLDRKIHLLLVDQDQSSLEEVYKGLEEEEKKYVTIEEKNLFCFTEEDLKQYEVFLRCGNMEQLFDLFQKKAAEYELKPPVLTNCDYSVVAGLHSQINSLLVAVIQYMDQRHLLQMGDEDFKLIVQMIKKLNELFCQKFHDEILKKSKKGMILIYEYSTFDETEKKMMFEIKKLFERGRANEVPQVSRVLGAYEAELDLAKRMQKKEIKICDWNYFVWPFFQEKYYLMIGYYIVREEGENML